MKYENKTNIYAFRMVAGAISATVLLSACVSNQPQGVNSGLPTSTQLAGGIAQSMLSGQGGSAVAAQLTAGTASTVAVNLPAKMACKDITARLVKTRSDMAAINSKQTIPTGGDNKLAMAGSMASLAGSLTGNAQLAQIGNQIETVGGNGMNAGDNAALANLDAVRAELEARGTSQKCKLPAAPVAKIATPAAPALSCGQIKQALKAINVPAAPANGLADKAQTVGMLSSLAGSLTGNEALKAVGDQANAIAVNGTPTGDIAARKAALETQAKSQRCKL